MWTRLHHSIKNDKFEDARVLYVYNDASALFGFGRNRKLDLNVVRRKRHLLVCLHTAWANTRGNTRLQNGLPWNKKCITRHIPKQRSYITCTSKCNLNFHICIFELIKVFFILDGHVLQKLEKKKQGVKNECTKFYCRKVLLPHQT